MEGGAPRRRARSTRTTTVLVLMVGIACAAFFLVLAQPQVPWGPVIGTGQDEWYNVLRSLRALYEYLHPSYFIHPALYYELLAMMFACKRVWLWLNGSASIGFLDYFLAHQSEFLDLARCVSLACGALTVVAAVWLGTLLSSTIAGGLLAGVIVAVLPLLRALATCIRVDALALATYVAATALIVRWHRNPTRGSFTVASVGIGIAASANYPAALLLLVLGWLGRARAQRSGARARNRSDFLRACATAFGTFLVLNPYVLLDVRLFLRWFLFQAAVPLYRHPHAPEPTVWRYLEVLRGQGPAAVAASAVGVLAMVRPREPSGTFAVFSVLQIAAFSLMTTQYDRFVLPAIALLCIAGAAWVCAQASVRIGPRVVTLLAVAAAGLVVWSSWMRFLALPPRDVEPDYRAEMFDWIGSNVPASARLLIESDTLPLLQTVYDPVDRGQNFQALLRDAFQHAHPQLIKNVIKAQFIAAVYNYDPKLLETEQVFFLTSSENREFIDANRDLLPAPVAFYAALDARAVVVHQTRGFHEKLLMYRVGEPRL